MRNQKGITLVALVITIIVLLILAAVTIAALGGSNGILTNASNAQVQNELGEAKDLINLAANEGINEYYTTTYVNGTAQDTDLSLGGSSSMKNNVQAHVLQKISAVATTLTTDHGMTVLYATGDVGDRAGTTTVPTVNANPTQPITIQVVSKNKKAAIRTVLNTDGGLEKWEAMTTVPTV